MTSSDFPSQEYGLFQIPQEVATAGDVEEEEGEGNDILDIPQDHHIPQEDHEVEVWFASLVSPALANLNSIILQSQEAREAAQMEREEDGEEHEMGEVEEVVGAEEEEEDNEEQREEVGRERYFPVSHSANW